MSRVVLMLIVAVAVLGSVAAVAQDPGDEVAVLVNGEPIHDWEFKLLLPQVEADMESRGLDVRGREVMEILLGRAIDSKLLAQEARRRGIEPHPDRIETKMSRLIEQAGGRGALEAELIRSGLSYDQLRSTVVEADLVRSLVEAEGGGGTRPITDDDVTAYYDDHPEMFTAPDKIRTRHIMIRIDADASDVERAAARIRIESARRRALAGEDFAELAREISEGPNASRGGDLGFTPRGLMVAGFDEVVWSLEPGDISEVIESDLGYHLAKVEEIREGERLPIDEARPLIEKLITQMRNAEVIATLVADLRTSAEIREPGQ
jgi:parvulin-like peptidyl-prolyl isomerase